MKFASENNPGRPFVKGRSGNPVGRPRTVDRLRRDVARELSRNGGTLVALAVSRAINGDPACLAACVNLIGTLGSGEKAASEPEQPAEAGGKK